MQIKYKFLSYLFFLLILFIFTYFSFQNKIHNFIGEKLFLNYHQNDLATNILQNIYDSKKDYYTYFLLGRIYFVKNDLSKSIENYNLSLKLANENNIVFKEIYYGRGLTFGFLGPIFYTDAQADFEKYIELENLQNRPSYGAWAGYNDLSWIHFLKGNFLESEMVAKQGLEISPENPWLLNMLSVALIEQNKCVEVYPLIQKAKNLAEKMEPNEFGEAYSGDNKNWWNKGLKEMKKTINENMWLCAKVTDK